jgi:phosphoglycolate phosphatase
VTDPAFLVVFDLDGTLVDSSHDLADAGNALLRSYGAPALPPADVVAMVGDGARELVRRLLERGRVGVPLNHALARFLTLYDVRLTATTRPYEGVVDMLERIAPRATLAVLTNKPERPTHKLLDALGLARYFRRVIGGDGDFPRKPDPAGLRAIVDGAVGDPSRTLLVGDSPVDAGTAFAAGVPLCLARYGFGFEKVSNEDRARAAHEVQRPAEIADIVSRLTAS